ncbi:MAG: ATP-binding protein [Thermoplasmata archaeon]|nr:ATP-binding protein [Thermoplasmata archaeon]
MLIREDVIDYFKEYKRVPYNILERELKIPLNSKFIISIIGPRRAGKTYFLFSLYNRLENAIYLNLEDTRLSDITFKELREVVRIFIEMYGKEPKYLLLDEIQNIDGWEKVVREFHDLEKYRIFISGSSSKLLSKEIATQLRGRALSFLLLPFSFREFLRFRQFSIERYLSKDEEAKIKNLLLKYMEYGGFPDVIKNEEKIRILREYSDLILFRDFIERHKIRNIELARMIHNFMLQNYAKEISIRSLYGKLKTITKAGKDTVYDYVSKLEDTMFFFFLRKYSLKVHLRESWPKKIYLCDTGLTKIVRYSQDYGRLMENTVLLEFMRKRNENPLLDVFYLKFPDYEVDFVIKEGMDVKQLMQVTYSSARDEIEKREIKALIKASDILNCDNMLIITWDYEDEFIVEGKKIKAMPLWKWLLK